MADGGSEMVERVARAITATRGHDPERLTGGPHPGGQWLDEGEPWWHGDIEAARAAIAAMREPTMRMTAEGMRVTGDPMNTGDTYRAMIDAALGKGA